MKKMLLLIFSIFSSGLLVAQWTTSGTKIYTNADQIGLGTSTPEARLDIKGSFLINNGESDGGRVIWRGGLNGTQEYRARVYSDGHLGFFPHELNPEVLTLTQSGNVGIGVFSPTARLEVNGDLLINTESWDGARVIWRGGLNGAQEYRARVYNDGHLGFFPRELSPEVLTLTQNGSVGIGTIATGNYKLAVEGKIGAREVKVTLENPWADYVFSEQYKLVDLKELEAYIKENKHLPGIPSANEVKENGGVDLGEMNRKLLEKVEELTLYMIRQDKEIKILKDQNKELQDIRKDLETIKAKFQN